MHSASRIVRGVIARQSQLMQELFSGATSSDAVLLQPGLAATMLLTTLMCGAVKCCSVERYGCLHLEPCPAVRAVGCTRACERARASERVTARVAQS